MTRKSWHSFYVVTHSTPSKENTIHHIFDTLPKSTDGPVIHCVSKLHTAQIQTILIPTVIAPLTRNPGLLRMSFLQNCNSWPRDFLATGLRVQDLGISIRTKLFVQYLCGGSFLCIPHVSVCVCVCMCAYACVCVRMCACVCVFVRVSDCAYV